MFYVSAKYHDGVGITDTEDGVIERYTYEQIAKIIKEYKIRVYGLVYTGSKYKARVTSPELVDLEEIEDGTVFLLDGKLVMRVSRDVFSFIIFDGTSNVRIPDKDLIARKHKVEFGVSDEVSDKIQYVFCKKYSTNPLRIYLGK